MKRLVPPLILMFLLFGCAKEISTNPNSNQADILVRNILGYGKWKLNTLKIGTTVQKLSASQLVYTKQYLKNLKYTDTDGIMGTWSMPTSDSLIEEYTNLSSGVNITQVYQIISITASELTLTYSVNGSQITAVYSATN